MEGYRIDRFLHSGDGSEERAFAQNDLETAEREFDRARRRAFARILLAGLRGRLGFGAPLLPGSGGEALVDLDSVAGLEREDGKTIRGIPPMSPKLAREWREAYLRMGSEEDGWRFELRPRGGAWYLAGGGSALVRLELARMRGERQIRARISECESRGDSAACLQRDGSLGAA
jgi:hypothetical protein